MISARREMETITAPRRLATALKHRAGSGSQPSYDFGDKVRVWREDTQKYEATLNSYGTWKPVFVHICNKSVPFATIILKAVHAEDKTAQHPDT